MAKIMVKRGHLLKYTTVRGVEFNPFWVLAIVGHALRKDGNKHRKGLYTPDDDGRI